MHKGVILSLFLSGRRDRQTWVTGGGEGKVHCSAALATLVWRNGQVWVMEKGNAKEHLEESFCCTRQDVLEGQANLGEGKRSTLLPPFHTFPHLSICLAFRKMGAGNGPAARHPSTTLLPFHTFSYVSNWLACREVGAANRSAVGHPQHNSCAHAVSLECGGRRVPPHTFERGVSAEPGHQQPSAIQVRGVCS